MFESSGFSKRGLEAAERQPAPWVCGGFIQDMQVRPMCTAIQGKTDPRQRVLRTKTVPAGGRPFGGAGRLLFLLFLALIVSWPESVLAASLPTGFSEETIGDWTEDAVGLTFDQAGVLYLWDRIGRIWIIENGVLRSTPLIDISQEVGAWDDYGLLGVALHPNFRQNGYFYLLYVVDHHYLAKFGTPNYNPNANEYHQATIGRLTRYTARASDNFHSTDMASRTVLLGETASTGIPILFYTHGVGTVLFARDQTLIVSCGDGAGLNDSGSASDTYYAQGLSEGIIKPKENIGAFRSQLPDSLSGKILRLDPATGDGVPGNPLYDAANPRSARSRLWSLGHRNPYRITMRPGTGSTNRADANPGVFYVGDVGYFTWEEADVVTGPGMNFGWPIFEGYSLSDTFDVANPANLDAPNPLFGIGGCTQQYFGFRELLREATLGTVSWPNPCDPAQQIPASIPRFVHSRPVMDWMHGSGPSRTGIFVGTNASVINIGAPGSPVSGPQFGGNCSIGGIWYQSTSFPAQFQNTYFFGDLGGEWIRNASFDASNRLVSVRDFATSVPTLVSIGTDPSDGSLYYIDFAGWLKKITYAGGGNRPPVAAASCDVNYGAGPLAVQFDGSASSDPDGQTLTYRWNFGDGTPTSTQANPAHVFSAPAGVPTAYTVTLTVTDTQLATNAVRLVISVNNTPPQVTITNPIDGSFYSLGEQAVINLAATVADNEQPLSQLSPQWQTVLHHNTHIHPNPIDTNWNPTTVLAPLGCDGDTYFYRITLIVTDPQGLSGTNEVDLFPDCSRQVPLITWSDPAPITVGTPLGASQLNAQASVAGTFVYTPPSGTVLPPGNGQVLSTRFTPADTNAYFATTMSVLIDVVSPPPTISIASPTNGARFNSGSSVPIVATVNSNGWAISWVEFFRDTTLLGRDTNAPYQLTWSSPSDGAYALTARAFYQNGGSSVTSPPAGISVGSIPSAPGSLSATVVTNYQIDLAWVPGSSSQSGFKLERSTDGTNFSQIGTTAAGTTAYSDTGLAIATAYYYRVRAYNALGDSPYSPTALAMTPPFRGVKINFQPAAAAVPAGYFADSGAVFGNRGNGFSYGWDLSNASNMTDRNSASSLDQRYDTFVATQVAGGGSIWEIAVPNGGYSVLMVSGDAIRNNSVYRYDVEGTQVLSGTPTSANRWITGSNTVSVADGRLTVTNGVGASNNKLCFIDITPNFIVRLTWVGRETNGVIRVAVEGPIARMYDVEACGNLSNWQSIATTQNVNGTISFTDPGGLGTQRFYRARLLP